MTSFTNYDYKSHILSATNELPLAALHLQQAGSMPPLFAEAATNKIHHWDSCDDGISVNHCLSWSQFINTHLYHCRQWSNL